MFGESISERKAFMKKKITAILTAAAMTFCMGTYFPVSAESVTLSCAPLIQNMINIEVKDKNGSFVEDADLKIMDETGVCAAKFKSNTDNSTIMNQSGLKVVPYDDNETLVKTSFDYALSAVPADDRIVKISQEGSIYLSDNESRTVDIYHCNDDDVSIDYTLEEGSIAVYTHPAYHLKSSDGYVIVNDVKYNFKNSFSASSGTAVYSVGELTSSCEFGAENSARSAGSNISLYPEEGTGEYFKVRIPITDLSDRFTGGRQYILPADENDSGKDIAFDILNDGAENFACLAIFSGSFVSAVIPDSDGYIEFYVDSETRSYTYAIKCLYTYSDDEYVHYTSHRDIGTFYYADFTTVTLECPDFPETGTSFMNVPAGKYTIKADSLPEGYVLSEPVEINVKDSQEIQKFTVVLEDYVEPTDPAEPESGITVYPKDNIVNIIVKDYNGELVTDAEMKLKALNKIAAFDSGGTHFEQNSTTHFTWYANDDEEKKMFIPFERFKEAAGIDDAFGMHTENSAVLSAFTGSYGFNSGQTQEVTLYTKDESAQNEVTLSHGVMGLYIDPKWEQNSAFTGYMMINGEPCYINPSDGSRTYGEVQYIDVGEFTDSFLIGLCKPGTVPTSGSSASRPNISEESTEYIKVRRHLSEFSDYFSADGSLNKYDYHIDPRNNTDTAHCIILIQSQGMISAVIPDEEGYIEFYAEKESTFCLLSCTAGYKAANFSSSYGVSGSCIASEAHTANYTAVKLPDTGVVLSEVPAGKYTLSFSNINEDYRNPGELTFSVEDMTGIQTVEIILQQSYPLGDVDDNGRIEINDARLALMEYARLSAGMDSLLIEKQKTAADINGNSKTEISDAAKILQYYANVSAGMDPLW